MVWYFTNEATGGPGTNGDGDAYAALGGGLRRWRTALKSGTRYKNSWMAADQASWINSTNLEAIAARLARFQQLLGEMTPEVKRDLALSRIVAARTHLLDHPSSCSARTRREEAFEVLYQVSAESFGMDQHRVDATYRKLEDYVFAELEYNRSRTCCWNSSTRAMYQIVMDYNQKLQQQAEAAQRCAEPVVFMGRERGNGGDGFQLFRQHAESIGRGAEWVAWSADETCPQANAVNDLEVEHAWIPWCEIERQPGGGGAEPGCAAANGSRDAASALPLGQEVRGQVCRREARWYAVQLAARGRLQVVLGFSHAVGDLDLELTDAAGNQLGSSAGVADVESITLDLAQGRYLIHVFGYADAEGAFTLKASTL
ncbi:MAG: hypothetical protein FJ125_02695 [Deltaproteobacteria bacterium]|nr:hypothetical protein [Deltaproteobacteria bacterium]